ncbi:MAG: hypothetical protein NC313_12490 [Butyrivibrio sp.]|nr:hypothetical protein [Butyrivibrio sp.]
MYHDNQSERQEAFARLEQLCRKGTVTDYDAELASYREEKFDYTKWQKEYFDIKTPEEIRAEASAFEQTPAFASDAIMF